MLFGSVRDGWGKPGVGGGGGGRRGKGWRSRGRLIFATTKTCGGERDQGLLVGQSVHVTLPNTGRLQ